MTTVGSISSYAASWSFSKGGTFGETSRRSDLTSASSSSAGLTVERFAGNNQAKALPRGRFVGLGGDAAPELREGLVVSVSTGRSALDAAYRAAGEILDTLDALRRTATLARDIFITRNSEETGQAGLDVEAGYLLNRIDRQVASAQVDDVNFIASGGLFNLGTGSGGAIQLAPQALDSEGLGIDGISLASPDDAEAALTAIDEARELAVGRTRQLAALAHAFETASAFGEVSSSAAVFSASAGFVNNGLDEAVKAYRTADLFGTQPSYGLLPRGSVANYWG